MQVQVSGQGLALGEPASIKHLSKGASIFARNIDFGTLWIVIETAPLSMLPTFWAGDEFGEHTNATSTAVGIVIVPFQVYHYEKFLGFCARRLSLNCTCISPYFCEVGSSSPSRSFVTPLRVSGLNETPVKTPHSHHRRGCNDGSRSRYFQRDESHWVGYVIADDCFQTIPRPPVSGSFMCFQACGCP